MPLGAKHHLGKLGSRLLCLKLAAVPLGLHCLHHSLSKLVPPFRREDQCPNLEQIRVSAKVN